MKTISKILATFCLLPVWHIALSCVTGIPTSIPAVKNIAVGKSAHFSLTWRINVSTAGTVTSSSANLIYGANTLPVNTVISKTANAAGTISILETVTIPSHIIYNAYRNGVRTITYNRTFSQGCTGVPATPAQFIITGSSAAGFAINQVSIRFDNDAPKRIVERNSKLGIYTRITYTGIGMLEGVWEIAEPSSTLGKAIYRTLKLVRQQQSSSGLTRIEGPALPTKQRGIHLVRFRITEPAVEFNAPVIRYYVFDKGKRPDFLLTDIAVLSPGTGSTLNQDTRFEWASVKKAIAYQLEIYADPSDTRLARLPSLGTSTQTKISIQGPLIAGLLLNDTRTSAVIPKNIRNKLEKGRWYIWRIIALNHEGKIIGISATYRLLVPSI